MCGIVAVIPLNKPGLDLDPQIRKRTCLYLHNEILLRTVKRGKDATGIALSFGLPYGTSAEDVTETGEPVRPFWAVLKQPVESGDFLLNNGNANRYKLQEEHANTWEIMRMAANIADRPFNHIVGHTRKGTLGDASKPLNNHPIIVGNIIGVHNGNVKNHREIFKLHEEMTRLGEVDSEALVQLLSTEANDRALTQDDAKFVASRVEGAYATIAYNSEHPETVLAFRNNERPLECCYIEELGVVVLASEQDFVRAAHFSYTRTRLIDQSLPPLSLNWRTIHPGTGVLINTQDEIDDSVAVESLIPTFSLPTAVLKEYKKEDYTQSTVYQGSSSYCPTNTTGQTTGTKTTQTTPLVKTASLEDLSDYGNVEGNTTEVLLAEAQVVDIEDSDTVEKSVWEEDSPTDLATHMAILAEKFLADDPQAVEDKDLFLNKFLGQFARRIGMKEEKEAEDLAHRIYPIMFGDGYRIGYKHGYNLSQDKVEEELLELHSLREKVPALTQLNDLKAEKLHKAGSFMANLKHLMLIAFAMSECVEVNQAGKFSFKPRMTALLKDPYWKDLRPQMVLGIYKDNDVEKFIELKDTLKSTTAV